MRQPFDFHFVNLIFKFLCVLCALCGEIVFLVGFDNPIFQNRPALGVIHFQEVQTWSSFPGFHLQDIAGDYRAAEAGRIAFHLPRIPPKNLLHEPATDDTVRAQTMQDWLLESYGLGKGGIDVQGIPIAGKAIKGSLVNAGPDQVIVLPVDSVNLTGEVIYVDRFGNLVTNVGRETVDQAVVADVAVELDGGCRQPGSRGQKADERDKRAEMVVHRRVLLTIGGSR